MKHFADDLSPLPLPLDSAELRAGPAELRADGLLREWCAAEVAPELDARLGSAEARFRQALQTGEVPSVPIAPAIPLPEPANSAASPRARRLAWAAMAAAVLVVVAGVARRWSDGSSDPATDLAETRKRAVPLVIPPDTLAGGDPEHESANPKHDGSNPNSAQAVPANYRLEKDVVWQTADDGTIRLEDGSTVRRLRRVRVEYIRRLNESDAVEWQIMLVPQEQVYLVPVTTY